MYTMKSIHVNGFRGQNSNIKLNLNDNVNFLIGKNGTGKTSFINLINACLSVDREYLFKFDFESIVIKFKMRKRREVPFIEVTKDSHSRIDYTIGMSAGDQTDPLEVHRDGGRRRAAFGSNGERILRGGDDLRQIKQRIGQIFNKTWLSLNRDSGTDLSVNTTYEDDEFEHEPAPRSGVDKRMSDVLSRLRGYYFALDNHVAQLTADFQKNWFLSFLTTKEKDISILQYDIDFDEERRMVESIFDRFEVEPHMYAKQLETHVRLGKEALEIIRSDKALPFDQFFIAYDAMRLHRLVEQWQALQKNQKKITSPKSDFVNIASKMLYKKEASIGIANELSFWDPYQNEISVNDLSSGEKQLIIFLAEVILQQKRPFIFFADEPELSLHIEWQEQLVENLIQINPNAQIFFATHSPDIVGNFQDNVFDMEDLAA